MNFKIVEAIMTLNPCYNYEGNMTVKGFMLHSVGCPQPSAMVFINSWNNVNYGNACVHGFIDANTGAVYQTLPWNHVGWHGGGASNYTHIGIEMCEPACISYSGINISCSDYAAARAAVKRTYDTAVQLFAYLCQKFNLNPLKPGVIVSHSEGYKLGIATNHGDPEHLWKFLGMGYTMDTFRKAVKDAMASASSDQVEDTSSYTKIMGKAKATADQMKEYIKKTNPSVAQSVLDMIPHYLSEGEKEGVRGDIAFAQSCLETGNFGFVGSAVTLDQSNFCGMGVTQNGMKGNSFDTPQLGIRAQIQHLKAYGSVANLVNECVDPRFKYVKRASAEYVEWLGIPDNPSGVGWAGGSGYGKKIMQILEKIMNIAKPATQKKEPVPDADFSQDPGTMEPPFKIRVKITNLNVRTGPGTGYARIQNCPVGVYTITEVKQGKGSDSGWGRLKSGLGWISLDFTELA